MERTIWSINYYAPFNFQSQTVVVKVIYDNELFHARTSLFFDIDTEINSCLLTMDIVSATERGAYYKLKTLVFCFSVFFRALKVYNRSNVEKNQCAVLIPNITHSKCVIFFKVRCHRVEKSKTIKLTFDRSTDICESVTLKKIYQRLMIMAIVVKIDLCYLQYFGSFL